jgi:hypothetical protein
LVGHLERVEDSRNAYNISVKKMEICERPNLTWEMNAREVKLSLSLIKHHILMTHGKVNVWMHTFLTSRVDRDG